jgi:MFS family permease
MLEGFAKNNTSIFFTIASTLSLVIMFFASKILRSIGVVKFCLTLFLLSIAALLVIGNASSGYFVIPAFIIYFSLNIIVVYCFDLFIEHYSKISSTGKTRGSYLALNNLAWVSMPLVSGLLISRYGLNSIYTIASVVVALVALLVIASQKNFKDKHYVDENIFKAFHKIQKHESLKDIVIVSFILQLFYSVMVIYSPIYLHNVQNFSWKEIGVMFGLMLIAFPITQYPLGKLSDKIGERKFLIAGLGLASIAVLVFAWAPTFVSKMTLIGFAIILFLSRVGAATIEVMCDAYFFKNVSDRDSEEISAYRMLNPIGYILGPIISILILNTSSFKVLFTFLAILVAFGIFFARKIKEV